MLLKQFALLRSSNFQWAQLSSPCRNLSVNQCVHLARTPTLSRKPLKVFHNNQANESESIASIQNSHVDEDELLNLDDEIIASSAQTTQIKKKKSKSSGSINYRQTINGVTIPKFEQLQDNKKFISQVIAARNKKFRKRKGIMLLEGSRLINDAVDAGVRLKILYFDDEKRLAEIQNLSLLESQGVQFGKIKGQDIRLFSELKTCPSLMGVFERPFAAAAAAEEEEDEDVVEKEEETKDIITEINKPNSNSLPMYLVADNIRDPGNLGTLIRAAAGCGVKQIICTKGCVDIWESKVIRASAGAVFRLPILIDMDWDRLQQKLQRENEFFGVYMAELDNSSPNASTTRDSQSSSSSTVTYTQANYFNKLHDACVLVVGGETGTSREAQNFLYTNQGHRVTIEMYSGVNSLNSSVAGSVILYEMRRQFFESQRNET